MKFKGKTAVITGSADGIGRVIAEAFASQGAHIVLSDINGEKLQKTAAEFSNKGFSCHAVTADVSQEKDAVALMDETVKKFGSVDIAVLNAGIIRDGLLVKTDKTSGDIKSTLSLSDWQQVINVNLTGVFLTGREAAVKMIQNRNNGVIIPISSISRAGNLGQSNYSAAKAGVSALTVTWSKELSRYGIRVAAIAPGFIETEMVMKSMNQEALEKWKSLIPVGRLGKPQEIADTAVFIAENHFITGVTLEITGGIRI